MMSDPLTLRDEGRPETYHVSYNRLEGGGGGGGVGGDKSIGPIYDNLSKWQQI